MAVVTFSRRAVHQILGAPPPKTRSFHDEITQGLMLEVRPSANATWYYRYRARSGRVRMKRIGCVHQRSVDEARAAALSFMQQVREGHDPVEDARAEVAPDTSLRDFVQAHYIPHAKSRKRAWAPEQALLDHHVLPAFGHQPLSAVSRMDVVRWHEQTHANGYAVGTCNRILVLLRHIYNCAIRWEVIPKDTNPAQGVKPLKGAAHGERYLSDAELERLLAVLDDYAGRMVADIILLLIFTGARKREVLDARWEHIDRERGILTVPRSKSGKPRYIQLSSAALEVINRQFRTDQNPWVFPSPKTGRPLVSIFNAWNTIRYRAGLADVRLHDLRHSFASFLVNSGRSLYEVQALLGHANPRTTMRYAHLSQSSLQDAAEVVAVGAGRGTAVK